MIITTYILKISYAYKRVLPFDQPVDAAVGVDEDGQGDEQLDHRLQDRVVEQLVIESKLFADLRENLGIFVKKKFFRMKTSSITTDPSLSLAINPFSSRLTYQRQHYSQILKFWAIHLVFKEVGKGI